VPLRGWPCSLTQPPPRPRPRPRRTPCPASTSTCAVLQLGKGVRLTHGPVAIQPIVCCDGRHVHRLVHALALPPLPPLRLPIASYVVPISHLSRAATEREGGRERPGPWILGAKGRVVHVTDPTRARHILPNSGRAATAADRAPQPTPRVARPLAEVAAEARAGRGCGDHCFVKVRFRQ
jgi:hypothetical protein